MVYSILGQIVILFIIIICCSRVFFLKFGKVDVLTVLAPLSLILTVFQIIAWKIDFFSIVLLAISILAFCVNFRAFLRFLSGLYVDHYSAAFKTGAILTIAVALANLISLFVYFPYAIFDTNFKSQKEVIRVDGTFSTGFSECSLFGVADGEVNIFTSDEKSNGVVLFFPDKRSDTDKYIPFLRALSEKGYTVCSADFFANDLKWFYSVLDFQAIRREAMVYSYIENPVKFDSEKEFYVYNTIQECEAVYDFAREYFPEDTKFILAGDGMTIPGIEDFAKTHSKDFEAVVFLEESEDYKTPGFGFIENLQPVLSLYLGFGRQYSFENCRSVASAIDEKIREKGKNLIFQRDVLRQKALDSFNEYMSRPASEFVYPGRLNLVGEAE